MKTFRLIVTAVLAMVSLTMAAQTTDEKTACRTGWYLEAGGGAQILFSKDAQRLELSKRLTPSLSLALGKWFSPFWGLRLQVQGYSFNGFSTPTGIYTADATADYRVYGNNDPVRDEVSVNADGTYRHYLRYVNAHADFQVSLANLLFGPCRNRRLDVIPAVGIGYMRMFAYRGTPSSNVMTGNFALMTKYTLSRRIDLNLEISTAVMPDQFDGRIAGRDYENSLSATLGVTYRFPSKRCMKKPEPVVQYVTRVVHDTVYSHNTIERVVEKTAPESPVTLASVLFPIGKAQPQAGQEALYVNISHFVKDHPSARVRLDGYADAGTGTADINMKLSKQRVAAVRDILVNDYGVPASSLETRYLGSTQQPYDKNTLNRVVVITGLPR